MNKPIQPATPLPWIVNMRKHIISADGFKDVATTADGKVQVAIDDAAYIVEAANAYPRLLAENARLREALQATQEHLDARPTDTGLDIIRQKNSALLRKLGAE